MPILDRARGAAMEGLGIARRDGILVKSLPHFTQIADPFKSRPFFETKATRDLDLLIEPPKDPSDAVKIASVLPPWAVYAALERATPATLLEPAVLTAMASFRGIPSALRRDAEPSTKAKDPKAKIDPKEAKAAEARMSGVALSRVRIALAYGSRSDAEAVASWSPKEPLDQLRVAVAKALLGPVQDEKSKPKAGTPAATAPKFGFDLGPLDALAKKGGAAGEAAQLDAAMLSLDAAQTFGGESPPEGSTAPDPKKAYEDAIARLDAVTKAKKMDPARVAKAKAFADGARESVKLLDKPTPKPADKGKKL